MYKTILVGTDGSSTADKAVVAAADLARQWGAKLHMVTAFRSSSSGMAGLSGAAMVDTGAESALRHEAAGDVGQRSLQSFAEGIDAELHAVPGDPADAILDTANAVDADLIVVGSKGMRGARRILGSVPNSVAHGASCAVLIVKTD